MSLTTDKKGRTKLGKKDFQGRGRKCEKKGVLSGRKQVRREEEKF